MTSRLTVSDDTSGRVAVIGDIGGRFDELVVALRRLGVDTELGVIPDDLTIVQAGDLIHKGPKSAEVVALVDRLIDSERWVQLVGNHESMYLPFGVRFSWGADSEFLNETSVATLQSWYRSGRLKVAAAIETAGETLLVTHAGLTYTLWVNIGRPDSAAEAQWVLNSLFGSFPERVTEPGFALGGRTNENAGVTWASAPAEVYPSWAVVANSMPFSQIHGHSSGYLWTRQRWVDDSDDRRIRPPLRRWRRRAVDSDLRHAHLWAPGGGRFIGVDPGFSNPQVRWPWGPLVLADAVVRSSIVVVD